MALPNCSNSSAASLLMVTLTLGVPLSSFVHKLIIRRGRQCAWGTAVRNVREIQFLSKLLHCVRCREEDPEAVLDPTLHLLLDERSHIQGAGQGVGPLGDGCLQRPEILRVSGLGGDSVLYIRL